MLMLPEITVIATAFVLLLTDLFLEERRRTVLAPIALLGLGLATAFTLYLMPQTGEMFGGRFAVDTVAWWFKLIFLLAALLTVGISLDVFDGRVAKHVEGLGSRGEFYTILLFSLTGAMYLISARDLVSLYVSLELTTIPLYALAAWRREAVSGEAGLKYVILGALASAVLLYGMGFLYGMTGETNLVAIGKAVHSTSTFWFAAALVTAGVGFKLTLVPFHMWAAEVYQGAPTPVTAYLSVASKAAGLALMFQLFYRVMGNHLQAWAMPIAIIATLTMTVGNLAAIVQDNIKRFMAFSAISQAGVILLGFLSPSNEGVAAMLFYMLVYIITNLLVFGVIMYYSNNTGRERICEYKGLSQTNPLMALALMLGLFSLAGIPPLSGFVGKFFLFSVAAKAGYNWLVGVAAINGTVSLYYYLRIVRQMYIEAPVGGDKRFAVTPAIGATVLVTTAATMVMGIVPMFYESVYAQTSGWITSLLQ